MSTSVLDVPTASTVRPIRPVRTPARPAMAAVLGVGTQVPARRYSQDEVLARMGIDDPRIRSIFQNSAIDFRHLATPALARSPELGRGPVEETQGVLLARHRAEAVDMAATAVRRCLDDAGLPLSAVRHITCVTSTGFLTPGLSALVIERIGLNRHCSRADIVGMGCNAGLNALNLVDAWARGNPGQLALLVCAEACSAAYVYDDTIRTAVVNSLFGDGAAAIALRTPAEDAFDTTIPATSNTSAAEPGCPEIVAFSSLLIHEAKEAMRYEWDDAAGKFSFFLDPDIPYVVGANAEHAVDRLLDKCGLRRFQVAHWLVHSGGKKVIDAVKLNLGLSRHALRHTSGVLRDYGNLSSGSFLFSYQRLRREGVIRPGDRGVLMTMGPGSTIETALLQW